MVLPKTYKGYNSEGTVIVTTTAVDANTEIDPNEVRAAIEHVKEVFATEMYKLARALRDLSTDAGEAVKIQGCSVIVEGTNSKATIEDTAQILEQISSQVTSGLDSLYDDSVKYHDEIQRSFNVDAYNSCCTQGVVKVA